MFKFIKWAIELLNLDKGPEVTSKELPLIEKEKPFDYSVYQNGGEYRDTKYSGLGNDADRYNGFPTKPTSKAMQERAAQEAALAKAERDRWDDLHKREKKLHEDAEKGIFPKVETLPKKSKKDAFDLWDQYEEGKKK